MNHDEVMKLTDEQLIDAIWKERHGYTFVRVNERNNRWYDDEKGWHYSSADLIDYLHDLNADFELLDSLDTPYDVSKWYGLGDHKVKYTVSIRDAFIKDAKLTVVILRAYLLSKEV